MIDIFIFSLSGCICSIFKTAGIPQAFPLKTNLATGSEKKMEQRTCFKCKEENTITGELEQICWKCRTIIGKQKCSSSSCNMEVKSDDNFCSMCGFKQEINYKEKASKYLIKKKTTRLGIIFVCKDKFNPRGADADENQLNEIFTGLGFKVKLHCDINSSEVEKVLEEGVKTASIISPCYKFDTYYIKSEENLDVVFLAVSCHGIMREEAKVHGSNNPQRRHVLFLNDFAKDNNQFYCTDILVKKLCDLRPDASTPVVLFIQACSEYQNEKSTREDDGAKIQISTPPTEKPLADIFTAEDLPMAIMPRDQAKTAEKQDRPIPVALDLNACQNNTAIMFASAPGKVAYQRQSRDIERGGGGWMIHCLYKVYQNYWKDHLDTDLYSILTLVNHEMSMMETEDGEDGTTFKSTGFLYSRLCTEIRFSPPSD